MAGCRKKGYRSIVVAGRPFQWRFANRIVVVPLGRPGGRVLELDLGWTDPWLEVNTPASERRKGTHRAVTPAFVAAAVSFALSHGWDSEARGGRFLIRHSEELGFQVAV